MNVEQIINALSQAIIHRKIGKSSTYYIVIRDKKIDCIPRECIQPKEAFFGVFNNGDLNEGLSTSQWFDAGSLLAKFFEETGIKCQL